MATYISLMQFTQKGIEHVKEGPSRVEAARKMWAAAGGKLTAFYLTMGQYDAVAIVEVPDEQTGARLALSVGMQGNVRTETLRAFTEDEYKKIVGSLP